MDGVLDLATYLLNKTELPTVFSTSYGGHESDYSLALQ